MQESYRIEMRQIVLISSLILAFACSPALAAKPAKTPHLLLLAQGMYQHFVKGERALPPNGSAGKTELEVADRAQANVRYAEKEIGYISAYRPRSTKERLAKPLVVAWLQQMKVYNQQLADEAQAERQGISNKRLDGYGNKTITDLTTVLSDWSKVLALLR